MIPMQKNWHKDLKIINFNKTQTYFQIPLEFLEKNVSYALTLSFPQVHNSKYYFPKFESMLISNISPANAIINISQNFLKQTINLFNFNQNLNSSQTKQQNTQFFTSSEEIKYNYSEKCNRIGNVLLLKFKPYNNTNQLILSKNNIQNSIFFVINGKFNQSRLFNDLKFTIQARKIVKSIQLYIENNYKNENENSVIKVKEFIVPLLEYPNIALLIQTNNDINKTNFNSIVKQNFSIKEIYTAINVNDLLNTNSLLLKESNEVNNEDNDTVYSSNFTLSYPNFPFNNCYKNNTKPNYIDNNYIRYKNNQEIYYKSFQNTGYNYNYMDNSQKKYSNASWRGMETEVIIVNSNDLFAKTLFNRFQDRSNTTCNFKILEDFLTLNKKQLSNKININDFINIFYEVSCLSLEIPLFKLNGELTKISLTPSLHSLKLYIKDKKLLSILSKKYNKSDNIEIKDFKINIMKEGIIKITYNEQRPYYLTESFYEKISELTNEIKYIKKITKDKIIIDKSYISLSWNIIKNNYISQIKDSFNSYYLFNGEILGIVPGLNDYSDFWVRNIEEISNKRGIINYRALISENNINKVQQFISKADLI